jgi:hypothetical protein
VKQSTHQPTPGDSTPELRLCDNNVRFRHDLAGFQRRMITTWRFAGYRESMKARESFLFKLGGAPRRGARANVDVISLPA